MIETIELNSGSKITVASPESPSADAGGEGITLKHRNGVVQNGHSSPVSDEKTSGDESTKEIVWEWGFDWWLIFYLITIHVCGVYGIYCLFLSKWQTILFTYMYAVFCGFGVTAGAHRLWAHRSYKAKLPLRIILAILFTATWQKSILTWSINHRVHHKYSDTDADPHNSNRGFFFSHVGWLCITPHPLCLEKKARLPIDDLLADPVVVWQHKLFHPFAILFCYILPVLIPIYCWNEDPANAFFFTGMLRNVVSLQSTFTVNSLAHMWGTKRFDVRIKAVKNKFVTWLTSGEGFHNYHHAFPRDYAACEYSNHRANKTTKFIDFFANIGWAYDRIKISPEMIMQRRMKTGDLSLEAAHHGKDPHESDHSSDEEKY